MIDMRLEAAKGRFFDASKILDRVERAELKALARFGAFVRRRMKSSIRKRNRVALPGMPPSSHMGLLRDFIFFFVEREEKNVVVGPILLNSKSSQFDRAPALLEYGGDAVRRRYDKARRQPGRLRHYHYRGNPFARPAFQAELSKAAEQLRGQVKE